MPTTHLPYPVGVITAGSLGRLVDLVNQQKRPFFIISAFRSSDAVAQFAAQIEKEPNPAVKQLWIDKRDRAVAKQQRVNLQQSAKLLADLRRLGYGVRKLQGHFAEFPADMPEQEAKQKGMLIDVVEDSFLAMAPERRELPPEAMELQAALLGRKYGQNAVLFSDGVTGMHILYMLAENPSLDQSPSTTPYANRPSPKAIKARREKLGDSLALTELAHYYSTLRGKHSGTKLTFANTAYQQRATLLGVAFPNSRAEILEFFSAGLSR